MTNAAPETGSREQSAGKTSRRAAKPRPSPLEKLAPEELQSLRLDEASRDEFEALSKAFNDIRAKLLVIREEDVAKMDDARYGELSVAEADHRNSGMAVVHFLAPRILRLRDGAAKRKWRSFLTKFRKDERLG